MRSLFEAETENSKRQDGISLMGNQSTEFSSVEFNSWQLIHFFSQRVKLNLEWLEDALEKNGHAFKTAVNFKKCHWNILNVKVSGFHEKIKIKLIRDSSYHPKEN